MRFSKSILAVTMFVLVIASSLGSALAQVPSFGEVWPIPGPPPGYSSWAQVAMRSGYASTGPIVIGGVGFSMRVLDRNYQEKQVYYQSDAPIYAEITVPPNVIVAVVVGMIEYDPPGYDIRYMLPGTAWIFIGTAGSTSKIGGFPRGTADPEGKYAWRTGIMACVGPTIPCTWYWGEYVQYYDFMQKPPVVTPVVTPDFMISAQSPPPLLPGESGTATVLVTANPGWKGDTISLTASATGVSANLNPSILTGTGSSTLTIQVPKDTGPGPYSIRVVGSGAGQTHEATCQLIVSSPPVPPIPWWQESVVIGSIIVVALVVVGVLAGLLLTRRKPSPPTGYKPVPTAPAISLKPAGPPAVKPAAHVPRVVGRREEKK